jgi:hypothetical protein
MILGKLVFSSFISKLAAPLDEHEKQLFKKVIQNQQKFDQIASSGKMTDTQREAHRANTERVQRFMAKRKDSNKKIPAWAKDLEGKVPGGTSHRARGGVPHRTGPGPGVHIPISGFAAKHPYLAAARYGAMYGGTLGSLRDMVRSDKSKKREVERAEKRGPIAKFTAKHPVIGGAGFGAASGAGALYGATKAGLPGVLAGAFAPVVASSLADKGLKSLSERKKRREEFAKGTKEPAVSKPQSA